MVRVFPIGDQLVHCDIGIIFPVKSERSFIADRTFILS